MTVRSIGRTSRLHVTPVQVGWLPENQVLHSLGRENINNFWSFYLLPTHMSHEKEEIEMFHILERSKLIIVRQVPHPVKEAPSKLWSRDLLLCSKLNFRGIFHREGRCWVLGLRQQALIIETVSIYTRLFWCCWSKNRHCGLPRAVDPDTSERHFCLNLHLERSLKLVAISVR